MEAALDLGSSGEIRRSSSLLIATNIGLNYMKTKGKNKLFQTDWWNKKDGEMTYKNFRKWFLKRRTCRYFKHRNNDSN